MSVGTMDELFVDELKDLYSAEKQITRALPKLVKAATSDELRQAFQSHLATALDTSIVEVFGGTHPKVPPR